MQYSCCRVDDPVTEPNGNYLIYKHSVNCSYRKDVFDSKIKRKMLSF